MEPNHNGLTLSRVGKTFRAGTRHARTALEDVSLQLAPGQVGVLLGPSGCGKSTLLRMVAGLEEPTTGALALNGQAITGPGRDRGMVFQSYTSFPWLTVRQNVAYGLRITGDSSSLREGAVDYFIDAVRLGDVADAYPHELSGGMRQRVAIARTLANHPALLLMDEPFGALDPETRWQMQSLLLEIVRKERTTVLLVSHDIEEALYLGDVVFFLSSHPGRLRETIRPGFKASLGGGAFVNDKPIAASATTSLSVGSVGVGFNGRTAASDAINCISALIDRGGVFFRNASGGLMLAYAASGRLIGYLEAHMNAWDCLAGLLIAKEAGNGVAAFDVDHALENGARIVVGAPGVYDDLSRIAAEAFASAK